MTAAEEDRRIQACLAGLDSGDAERAEGAALDLIAAARRDPQQADGAILEALHGRLGGAPDPEERWWAARTLAEIPDPRVPAWLSRALDDPDAGVRRCAALALRLQPDPHALPRLIDLLESDDRLLARLCADALGALGAAAVPGLLEVMQDGPQAARLEAVRALAEIGDQRSIPVLFHALDDDSALIEYWAEKGLEDMGIGMTFFKP